jgi:hypothetical protein
MLHTAGRCIWFSDQVEQTLVPAQMAHPLSIDLLRSVMATIPSDLSATKRVYVSRADAVHRRVLDEPAVMAVLQKRGFEQVVLSRLSARQQIGLFRGAEMIVGPHGMGLTHIIAADHLHGVVELFHPASGTDAYAFITKAGGIRYDWVIGTAGDGLELDYTISGTGIARINQAIDAAEANSGRPSWRKPVNLLSGSKTFAGFKALAETVAPRPDVPELIWGNAVLGHCRQQAATDGPDVGGWLGVRVIAGLRYTASCWVWISSRFGGSDIRLVLDSSSDASVTTADLGQRATWQRIFVSGTAISDFCGVRLCVTAPKDDLVFSTCWQLARGDAAGPYVGTR